MTALANLEGHHIVEDGRFLVSVWRIIGTNHVIASVYQAIDGIGSHSSIRHEHGRWWGKVGTDHSWLGDHLPAMSRERSDAYTRWRAAQSLRAREILAGFAPDLEPGATRDGFDFEWTVPAGGAR